jgi:RHH-type proline utilization regulon transcriptional repressor/proline dehydrogenase/delta 1-pyrroline-5-carboxylate dehydrogenase
VAALAVETMLEAGLPADVLALLPGPGEVVGAALTADARVAGVAFTGSTDTAAAIARTLASRVPLVPLIAETGGLNALIADSSALPEQVVADAIVSAFDSAGQRCSALRVLCVQRDIAPRIVALLEGAMDELAIGDPASSRPTSAGHRRRGARCAWRSTSRRCARSATCATARRCPRRRRAGRSSRRRSSTLDRLQRLTREIFGPVLHVVEWDAAELDALVDAINASGYG